MKRITPKKHQCKTCKKETWGRECLMCKSKRYRQKSLENKKKKPKKATGELELLKSIWNTRPRQSQVSGQTLHEFDVRFFSHILPKGSYPSFRLNPQNIILKTAEEHRLWHEYREDLKALPQWDWIFQLEKELKRQYNGLTTKSFNNEE